MQEAKRHDEEMQEAKRYDEEFHSSGTTMVLILIIGELKDAFFIFISFPVFSGYFFLCFCFFFLLRGIIEIFENLVHRVIQVLLCAPSRFALEIFRGQLDTYSDTSWLLVKIPLNPTHR